MFCTRCGQHNSADARFCSRCGSALVRPGDPVSHEPSEHAGADTERMRLEHPQSVHPPSGPTPSEHPSEHTASEHTDQTSTLNLAAIGAVLEGDGLDETADPQAEAAVEALPSGSALLVVKRGPNAGSRFLLDADLTTAGRHPDSDIFLDDVTVSRRHAEFRREGSTFRVQDVGSLNGTYLNRERIDSVQLSSDDEVQIGKFRLIFLTSSAAARTGGQSSASRP